MQTTEITNDLVNYPLPLQLIGYIMVEEYPWPFQQINRLTPHHWINIRHDNRRPFLREPDSATAANS